LRGTGGSLAQLRQPSIATAADAALTSALLQIALNRVGVTDARLIGIAPGIAERATLPEQDDL
jgi:hypothetical protein